MNARRSRPDKKAKLRRQAEIEADRLTQGQPSQYLEVLIEVLAERQPRQRGRPPGSGEVDDDRLERMADLYLQDPSPKPSLRRLALQVAQEIPGHSEAAIVRRVRRKFADQKDALLREAERRADPTAAEKEDLEAWANAHPAFAEDIEEWDL